MKGRRMFKSTIVAICGCSGKIAGRLDLESIRDFLSIHGVKSFLCENLCDDTFEEVSKLLKEGGFDSVVFGACRDVDEVSLQESMKKMGLDPFGFRVVDILREDSTERAGLMLLAARERLGLFGGTKEKNLTACLPHARGALSRRQFLTIGRMGYRLIPVIEPESCVSINRYCRLCINACPQGAITLNEGKEAIIQKDRCNGCGICIPECPKDAISHPLYTYVQLDKELETLLTVREGRPRIVMFYCDSNNTIFKGNGMNHLPPEFLPLCVPCLGFLEPFFILRSIEFGADGVVLFSNGCKGCKYCFNMVVQERNIELIRNILAYLNIEEERVGILYHLEEGSLKPLEEFSKGINGLPANPFKWRGAEKSQDYSPYSLSLRLRKRKGIKENLLLSLHPSIRVGMIGLKNPEECTLCGICGTYCPTGALEIKEDFTKKTLYFDYQHCRACAECMRQCPERIISVKRCLDLDSIEKGERILLKEDELLRCKRCGRPFLTQGHASKMKMAAGLTNKGSDLITSLCLDCRGISMFESLKQDISTLA